MARVPRHHYKASPNKVWVLGNRPEHFEDKEAVNKALEEGVVERKPLLFVEHPSARSKEGNLNASLSTLHAIIAFASSTDGVYLTQVGELFKKLDEQLSVSCIGDTLFVEENVGAGLTFIYSKLGHDKMIQLEDRVLMFYRKDAAVLPALEKGTYAVKLVENMPVLRGPGPGLVVKSAVYDIHSKTSEITLEAFVNKEITLEIDNMPAGKYLAKLQSEAGEVTVNISVADKGQLRLPLNLPQDTPIQISILPQ
jgi:hypothetical protein